MSAYKERLRVHVYRALGRFLRTIPREIRFEDVQAFHCADDGEHGLEVVWRNGDGIPPKTRLTHGTIIAAFTGPYRGKALANDAAEKLLCLDDRVSEQFDNGEFQTAVNQLVHEFKS